MNNRQCAQHPTRSCVYYGPDTSCRETFCELCFSGHTPSHQAKIVKLNNIQTEIISKIETKAQMKLGSVLKEKCQSICEKSFQSLTQQNSVDFDTQDLIDLIADTVIHKLFPKSIKDGEIVEEKKVNEEQPATAKKSGQRLFIAGGYNIETRNDTPKYKYWSEEELKALYGSDYIFPQVDDQLETFYVKSQNKVVLLSRLYQVFCIKDLGNTLSLPIFFSLESRISESSSYHVLDFSGKIILLVTLKNKLLIYNLKIPEEVDDEDQEEEDDEDEESFEEDFDEDDDSEAKYQDPHFWGCAGYSEDPRQKVYNTLKFSIHNLSIVKQFTFADRFRIMGSDGKDQFVVVEDLKNVTIYQLTYQERKIKLSCKHKLELPSHCSEVTIDDINHLVLVYQYPDLLVYREEMNKLSLITEVKGVQDRTYPNNYNYNKYNQMLIMDYHRLFRFSNGKFTHLKNLPKIKNPVMTRKGVLGKINKDEISFFPLSSLKLEAGVQIPTPDPIPAFEVLKERQIILNEIPKQNSMRWVAFKVLDDSEDEILIYVDASMSYGRKDKPEKRDFILTNQFIYAYNY